MGKATDKFEEKYIETLKKADIIADSPVEGTIILKSYGHKIWEQIKKVIGEKLEKTGYEDMYFPMFIPHSLLKKQDEHYKSFIREAVMCTKAGSKQFEDELIIRPTSETIIYPAIKEWIKTKADLPLKINQWGNIVRWEILKPTLPLIRNNEFLWHECHALHSTKEECEKEAGHLYEIYRELLKNYLAVDFFEGKKPERRKFAGAEYTLALEGIMRNKKCVQLATTHSLGQKFSKAFDIKIKSESGEDFVWISCAGLTTRLLGVLAMTHSDEKGLVLPPKIAPHEVAVIENENLYLRLKNKFRVYEEKQIENCITRGIPVIIENDKIIRRDTLKKIGIKKGIEKQISELLEDIQKNLLKKATNFKEKNTIKTENYEEFKNILFNQKGAVEACWCGSEECSKKIRKETKGSLRVINEINNKTKKAEENERCIGCGKKAEYTGIFAQSY